MTKDALGVETMPCKYCRTETRMLATEQCDGCWNIAQLRFEPVDVVAKIINGELEEEQVQALIKLLQEK